MTPAELRARYGPWALVTGASDGIGCAIARQLAEAGLHLVLVARRGAVLERLAVELQSYFPIEVTVIALDLARPGSDAELAERTRALDIGLVVAAAGFGTSGRLLDASLDDELAMIDVNARSVVSLVHTFGARLARRRRGGIVLMSSLLAFQGVARAATYAATKAFVQTLAEGVRHELSADGVDVIAVAPGPVRSGFATRARMTMSFAQTPDSVATAVLRALRRRKGGTIRPGFLSKFLEASLAILPRFGRVRMMKRIMASMTRESKRAPRERLHEGTHRDRDPHASGGDQRRPAQPITRGNP